jgi:small subunit ribosomal protein S13
MAEVRIQNVQLPNKKHIVIALTSIFGIGSTTAKKILAVTGIEETKKVFELTDEEKDKLQKETGTYIIEGDKRREVAMNIKRKKDIGSYAGKRHRMNLPLRKRTRTNARTRKGPRRGQQAMKKTG